MDTKTEVQHIDHLGLVSGVCEEAGIVELINEYIGKEHRKVSDGHAAKAMILNALGFSARALYLTPMFYEHRPVDVLVGPGITPEDLNESSLGTALDACPVQITKGFSKDNNPDLNQVVLQVISANRSILQSLTRLC